ncbi:MAG: DNA polymerase III subunit alpha [Firmicutes bacterium]|nr:DNA polymerase III subunit alpha [Bacillota bacterium]
MREGYISCTEGERTLSVHLHIHSDYSLLESCVSFQDLVLRAKEIGIQALALTDHNTTAGHVEFDRACRAHDMKPIFGLELDIVYPAQFSKDPKGDVTRLVFLAENDEGYKNLLRLASESIPVPLDSIKAFSSGIIVLGGGRLGQLQRLLEVGMRTAAHALNDWFAEMFGTSWYIQLDVLDYKLLVEEFSDGPFAAAQYVRYLHPEDHLVVQALQAIKHRGRISDFPVSEKPLLSWAEMEDIFSRIPQALDNSRTIGERCQVHLPQHVGLPKLPQPVDIDTLVWQGASKRYKEMTPEIRGRLAAELQVIKEMGFADYFLIVADIVDFAKRQNIPVGPGRGSAASSAVAYCLGITDVDPIAWGLVFERFLNKERQNLPDIDLDFCYVRRSEVIDYVTKRFGREHVALIGTYGTFGERSASQEVRKILQLEPGQTSNEFEFLSRRIRGLKRNRSTHAAGVVITNEPMTNFSAVYLDRDVPVTHLDMYSLQELGVLKIDLLGLRTLTQLREMEVAVQEKDPSFSLETIPLDDDKTFSLLAGGRSLGVFQLESDLYQDLLRALVPKSFQDIAALLALGRPGPLSRFPEYLRLRNNPEKVRPLHPMVEDVLRETYGLIVYQEQIIQVAHRLGRLSLGQADLLRTALGKKDQATVRSLKEQFVRGAQSNGLTKQEGEQLFRDIADSAGYAFNKAHSVSYALLTWRTAYLKAHHPLEFFLTLLNNVTSIDTIREYLLDCQGLGIEILPPDVRYSEVDCSIEGDSLRVGLGSIKYLSSHVVKPIVLNRYSGLYGSFAQFRKGVSLPENVLETLVYAGACDGIESRSDCLRALGIEPPGDLDLLRRERELVGIYLRSHPAQRFLPFVRHIQGESDSIVGEVDSVKFQRGQLCGKLDTPQGLVPFMMKSSQGRKFVEVGTLAAFLGTFAQWQFHVESVFPLGPVLIILPHASQLKTIEAILQTSRGSTPVVFRLSQELLHVLSEEFWVDPVSALTAKLGEAGIVYQWFDPWQERVSGKGF